MAVNVYLNFKGNCLEAVNFYANAFGVEKQKILKFGDVPPNPKTQLSEDTKDLVMHTFLNINGSKIMMSDVPEGRPITVGNNISLIVNIQDVDEIKKIFNKLKVGGKVHMEPQQTFFSKCYSYLIDKYGIGWQISCESESEY